MENTSKLNQMARRDVAYYRQRQKNRVFTELVQFFAEEAEHRGVTKKDLAAALSKDPAQITRWLSAPSNFELDTLSDILLALGAEMDHKIVRFSERPKTNYMHPLVAKHVGAEMTAAKLITDNPTSAPKLTANVTLKSVPPEIKVKVLTAAE
ncbi:helix-turn-helix transcriptional regulator [Bradyrhizobium sp. ISRA443]|uniref:helix-turn-helix domain-containing protein n=1 Tax=unclassified Bradyrhizobium TaxID=2631580 RepID=UPI00247B15CB|nr:MULTISPECIES: helix-turn-helix transcriptional regulator [unclassified Bradyrhizobium]WGS02371.1 helix-turn-helix transcriptional regulator [Bradyrhizobium sp. ISRA436]WGS09256.1 helix-turn-helix transcriptional regulator [Bradyrhizobium sp. ISRA437]WGS16145.1 helix-turn-helix transcriptional regulator [Bradyrhizobium sp. ISRA443]